MPLKLVPPRSGKSPNYRIRGTYLGERVDQSTGSSVEAVARKLLSARKAEIERAKSTPAVEPARGGKAFIEAAMDYMDAGGDMRFVGSFDPVTKQWSKGLIRHFGETLLTDIDQAAIDRAAVALYPEATPATRNRQVHTPISAILKRAGIETAIRRPKGWRGKKRVDWLQPEQAFRLFDAAGSIDPEFRALLVFLCYTGCRLSDALNLTCRQITLSESFAYFATTKNDDPRAVHLPPFLVAELANHPRGLDRDKEKAFRFRKCGRLYSLMKLVKEKAGADVGHVTFHTLCHTWATWMRRYAGLDTRGLVGTGRWRDEKSAARYEHVVASEESRKADLLPVPQRSKKRKTVGNPCTEVQTDRKLLKTND